jgi:hypothetical protein
MRTKNWNLKCSAFFSQNLNKSAVNASDLILSKYPNTFFWLGLSLLIPLYYGLIVLLYSSQTPHIVQDDARHHVVWLQRFVDPQLFPNDLIADYFQHVAPDGFKFFYWFFAQFGIEPLTLAKVLPLLLGLLTSAYFFGAYLQILPIPASGFLATLLLNQTIWLKDDLASATPRAFAYPIFAAFLYYLLRRSTILCLGMLALQGLFFPQLLLLQVAILTVRIFHFENGKFRFSNERNDYVLWLLGLVVTAFVLFPFTLKISGFGTVITADQMRSMPEFGLSGRSEYFGVDPISFMFNGASGIRTPLFPPVLWMSLGIPILLKARSPLSQLATQNIQLLWQVLIASLGLFSLAHILLFKLYFPSRYTYHSLRFLMPMAAAIVLTTCFITGWNWFKRKRVVRAWFSLQKRICVGLVTSFAIASLLIPAIPFIFLQPQLWMVGQYPRIYQFLSNQPPNILVASLTEEANNLPAFSHRSILIGGEFAFAYHSNYYDQFKQRSIDVIRAQYSSDLTEVQHVISKYGIDFFMIEDDFFQPGSLLSKRWLVNSSFQSTVLDTVTQLRQGRTPALKKLRRQCAVLSEKEFLIINASCILDQ